MSIFLFVLYLNLSIQFWLSLQEFHSFGGLEDYRETNGRTNGRQIFSIVEDQSILSREIGSNSIDSYNLPNCIWNEKFKEEKGELECISNDRTKNSDESTKAAHSSTTTHKPAKVSAFINSRLNYRNWVF